MKQYFFLKCSLNQEMIINKKRIKFYFSRLYENVFKKQKWFEMKLYKNYFKGSKKYQCLCNFLFLDCFENWNTKQNLKKNIYFLIFRQNIIWIFTKNMYEIIKNRFQVYHQYQKIAKIWKNKHWNMIYPRMIILVNKI